MSLCSPPQSWWPPPTNHIKSPSDLILDSEGLSQVPFGEQDAPAHLGLDPPPPPKETLTYGVWNRLIGVATHPWRSSNAKVKQLFVVFPQKEQGTAMKCEQVVQSVHHVL